MTSAVEYRGAVLDSEHAGDIRGALGTIRLDDTAPRRGLSRKAKTLLAIVGPGLIVMVGDNDAGAFGTYTLERVWLIVLRGYLLIAAGLVLARVVMLTFASA